MGQGIGGCTNSVAVYVPPEDARASARRARAAAAAAAQTPEQALKAEIARLLGVDAVVAEADRVAGDLPPGVSGIVEAYYQPAWKYGELAKAIDLALARLFDCNRDGVVHGEELMGPVHALFLELSAMGLENLARLKEVTDVISPSLGSSSQAQALLDRLKQAGLGTSITFCLAADFPGALRLDTRGHPTLMHFYLHLTHEPPAGVIKHDRHVSVEAVGADVPLDNLRARTTRRDAVAVQRKQGSPPWEAPTLPRMRDIIAHDLGLNAAEARKLEQHAWRNMTLNAATAHYELTVDRVLADLLARCPRAMPAFIRYAEQHASRIAVIHVSMLELGNACRHGGWLSSLMPPYRVNVSNHGEPGVPLDIPPMDGEIEFNLVKPSRDHPFLFEMGQGPPLIDGQPCHPMGVRPAHLHGGGLKYSDNYRDELGSAVARIAGGDIDGYSGFLNASQSRMSNPWHLVRVLNLVADVVGQGTAPVRVLVPDPDFLYELGVHQKSFEAYSEFVAALPSPQRDGILAVLHERIAQHPEDRNSRNLCDWIERHLAQLATGQDASEARAGDSNLSS